MDFDFHPTGDRIELPAEFADRLAAVYDRRPETVWEWWTMEGERSETVADGVEAADFYADEPTRHEVRVDGDRDRDGGYTPCVLDALNAAAAEDGTATVRSTDPVTDTVVTAAFGDGSVRVAPEDAVVSIGQKSQPDVEVESHDSMIDLSREVDEDAFVRNFCEYGNAFESEETYARWSAETDAVSISVSAAKIATLLHRLHRTGRVALVAGIVRTFLTDRARGRP